MEKITTDRTDPRLRRLDATGQQEVYLVLSDDDRAQGFLRPVRQTYRHSVCGLTTTMGLALAETYARQPDFYTGSFCAHCGTHFPLVSPEGRAAFYWLPDGLPVGS